LEVTPEGVNLVIQIGTYAAWAGGTFAIVYADLDRRPQERGHWGLPQWGGLSLLGGALLLPFYFSSTRDDGLVRGIGLGIGVAVLALVVRVGLSALFQVPVL
jgi:hypothetical protein